MYRTKDFIVAKLTYTVKVPKIEGKQIGQIKGTKLTTKKSMQAKAIILKHSQHFDGTLNDSNCRKLAGISRNSFYIAFNISINSMFGLSSTISM